MDNLLSGKKVGITLSGGGARGIAHIGVLQALQEHGIHPDMLVGCSAGSIVGSLYAAGASTQTMLELIQDNSVWKMINLSLPNRGLTKLTYLRERLADLIGTDDFAALQKPLYIAISNLNTGKIEVRHRGELFSVVQASCSIPLVFQPVEIDGDLYVDGGLLCNMPVQPIRDQVDFVIGVNVMPRVRAGSSSVNSIMGVAMRCFEMAIWANSHSEAKKCDLFIEPKQINRYHLFQFNKHEELYQIGYEATKRALSAWRAEELNKKK